MQNGSRVYNQTERNATQCYLQHCYLNKIKIALHVKASACIVGYQRQDIVIRSLKKKKNVTLSFEAP